MWVRIWYGGLRIVLGLSLLQYMGKPFSGFIFWLMEHEFAGKHDILVQILSPMAHNMHYNVTLFVAIYLLFWGITDVFLSTQLLANRLWAYPLSMILMSFFMTYEIFRLFHKPSPVLLTVILYDLLVLWFIWREYNKINVRPI